MSGSNAKSGAGAKVGEVKPKSSKFSELKKKTTSKKGLVLIVVVVVSIIIGLWLLAATKQQEESSSKGLCTKDGTSEVYGQAAAVMTTDSLDKLREVVGTIESQPEYQNDINCVVPLVTYYSFTSELDKARENMDRVKILNSEGQSVAQVYIPYIVSIDEQDNRLSGLQKAQKENRKNLIGF